jgi:hypothetical protein
MPAARQGRRVVSQLIFTLDGGAAAADFLIEGDQL